MTENNGITSRKSKYLFRGWILAVIITFMTCIVPTMDGIPPIGAFLFFGWEHWAKNNIVGLIAIIVLASGMLPFPLNKGRYRATLPIVGIILIIFAWILFQTNSDSFEVSFIFSLHFLVVLCNFVQKILSTWIAPASDTDTNLVQPPARDAIPTILP
jgi:hypothetical protein